MNSRKFGKEFKRNVKVVLNDFGMPILKMDSKYFYSNEDIISEHISRNFPYAALYFVDIFKD